MGGQLWAVVETLTLASLWVRLYSLVFLALDVIQWGIYSENIFLLSNWGAPLASCGSKNPVTPLPCFLQAQCHQ